MRTQRCAGSRGRQQETPPPSSPDGTRAGPVGGVPSRFEGKPQCHIVAIAKESGDIAISVGCMLSRVRTGMSNNEVTCAIPASRVGALIERLRAARAADYAVAAYAAEDSMRFGRPQ